MPRRAPHPLPCLPACLLPACLEALAPDVGPPAPMPACDDDLDPTRAVSFRGAVSPILGRACTSCHAPGGEGFQSSGLDLSTYAALRAGGTRSGAAIAVDGQPCASALWQKLGPTPPFGARMPRNALPLPQGDIDLIHDWIAEGARDD